LTGRQKDRVGGNEGQEKAGKRNPLGEGWLMEEEKRIRMKGSYLR